MTTTTPPAPAAAATRPARTTELLPEPEAPTTVDERRRVDGVHEVGRPRRPARGSSRHRPRRTVAGRGKDSPRRSPPWSAASPPDPATESAIAALARGDRRDRSLGDRPVAARQPSTNSATDAYAVPFELHLAQHGVEPVGYCIDPADQARHRTGAGDEPTEDLDRRSRAGQQFPDHPREVPDIAHPRRPLVDRDLPRRRPRRSPSGRQHRRRRAGHSMPSRRGE